MPLPARVHCLPTTCELVPEELDRAVIFEPSLRQVSHEEAEALCLAVIEGRQDLWDSDLSRQLIAVGTTFPDMAPFEQAANVYSDFMRRAALQVVQPFKLDAPSGSFVKEPIEKN